MRIETGCPRQDIALYGMFVMSCFIDCTSSLKSFLLLQPFSQSTSTKKTIKSTLTTWIFEEVLQHQLRWKQKSKLLDEWWYKKQNTLDYRSVKMCWCCTESCAFSMQSNNTITGEMSWYVQLSPTPLELSHTNTITNTFHIKKMISLSQQEADFIQMDLFPRLQKLSQYKYNTASS